MKRSIFIVSCVAVVACLPATIAQGQATVNVDLKANPKPYDPMIFGGFLEHFDRQIYGGVFEPGSPLADKEGFRKDVIEALKELKVPVIRWPGGCFVDSYHWRKGVGKTRQPYDDDRWGVVEPNTFGTDEFVALCRRLDAEPYICQNGLADVQEMADWVAYCNATSGPFAAMRRENGHAEPFKVRYWSVGNERSGKEYIERVRDAAIAMKQVDHSIQVTCSGAHGPNARMDPYLFQTAGKHLDLISVHEYWVANFQKHHTPDYLACMMLAEKPDAHFGAAIKSLEGGGVRGRIRIAFDEWNLRSWHHPGFSGHQARRVAYADPAVIALIKDREKSDHPSLYTMADALFCASFFNACLRHSEDVGMANIAPLVNTTGPLFVHPDGIVKRTHFHTMTMYANLLEDHVAGTRVTASRLKHGAQSVAAVDAVATVDKSLGKWAIALVNRHPAETVDCLVNVGDKPLEGKFKATVLVGDSPDAYNDIGHPDRVKPKALNITVENGIVHLPPHSLMIVQGKHAVMREKALRIGTIQPDLVTPPVTDGAPAPGRRVRQFNNTYAGSGVYHLLYLPDGWVEGKKYPVIVEYAGNQVKGICPGTVEGSNLGYGISAGKEVIWICMPFVDSANRQNANAWWGDTDATVDYCKQTVRRVCEEFGGDPSNLFLAGFSRGAIACNFIGLHDDDIASLWRGFIVHSHYEGVMNWPESTPEGARERLKRLKNRPQFISHEQTPDHMIGRVRQYLGREAPGGHFTFLELPFPDHTDTWVLRDIPERKLLREWFDAVLGADRSVINPENASTSRKKTMQTNR